MFRWIIGVPFKKGDLDIFKYIIQPEMETYLHTLLFKLNLPCYPKPVVFLKKITESPRDDVIFCYLQIFLPTMLLVDVRNVQQHFWKRFPYSFSESSL